MADDAYNRYYESILGRIKPKIRDAESDIYSYLLQLGQRQGVPEAMRKAGRATAPFAEELGEAATSASAQAEEMKEQGEQFNKQLALMKEKLAEQRRQFGERLSTQREQFQQQQQMKMFPYTGWTPEMMENLGYAEYLGPGQQGPSTQFSNVPLNKLGYDGQTQQQGYQQRYPRYENVRARYMNAMNRGGEYPGSSQNVYRPSGTYSSTYQPSRRY